MSFSLLYLHTLARFGCTVGSPCCWPVLSRPHDSETSFRNSCGCRKFSENLLPFVQVQPVVCWRIFSLTAFSKKVVHSPEIFSPYIPKQAISSARNDLPVRISLSQVEFFLHFHTPESTGLPFRDRPESSSRVQPEFLSLSQYRSKVM